MKNLLVYNSQSSIIGVFFYWKCKKYLKKNKLLIIKDKNKKKTLMQIKTIHQGEHCNYVILERYNHGQWTKT